jgi:hypothetical protein
MSVNQQLLSQARNNIRSLHKVAFVAAGDPAMGGAPPADPAMGGAPPADPAMGGAPPADPAMAGGGGAPPPDPMAAIMPMVQQAVQQAMAANGGGAGAQSGNGIKPKIDVNVEIMQIKKMLAKIVDAMGIHIPAQDMVATPEDLNQIAQGGAGFAASTPDNQAGGGLGQISPVQPMKSANEEWENGFAFDYTEELEPAYRLNASTSEKAAALLLRTRNKR